MPPCAAYAVVDQSPIHFFVPGFPFDLPHGGDAGLEVSQVIPRCFGRGGDEVEMCRRRVVVRFKVDDWSCILVARRTFRWSSLILVPAMCQPRRPSSCWVMGPQVGGVDRFRKEVGIGIASLHLWGITSHINSTACFMACLLVGASSCCRQVRLNRSWAKSPMVRS